MKKFIITEEEKKSIRGLYGLNEQTTGFSIPPLIINAISKIEAKYSFMDVNGIDINGAKYTGSEKLGVMQKYVDDTIGLDCWDNMSDKLKAQIYSYCFQADTSVPYKMKFIAGLANAIDSKISRGSIVKKGINDPNVQAAIKLIKDNCSNINSYYDNYLKVIDEQYKSSDYNNNYKYIWQYRPIAIDRIMGGTDIDVVLSDWDNFVKGKPTTQQPTTTTQPNKPKTNTTPQTNKPKTIEVTGINSFQESVKAKTSGGTTSIDVSSVVFSRTNSTFKVSYSTGETKIAGMTLMIDETSEDNLKDRITDNIKVRYPNLIQKDEWKGKVGKWYYEFLILIK
jgi:hypothetical protein